MARSVLCLLAIAFSVDLISARSEIPPLHSGMCPYDSCKRCKTDIDCDGKKCCEDGCGIKKCFDGKICPPWRICPRPCVHDNDCNDGYKCCYKDCVLQCVKAEFPCGNCDRDADCPFPGQKCCSDNDCKRRCVWPIGGRCKESKPCLECKNDRDCNSCEKCIKRSDGCESKCVAKTVESRPGFCPAETHPPGCHTCKSDIDCFFRRQICCDVGCGFRQCVAPGFCRPTLQCCNSDCECNKDEKCCPIDCGFRCVKKVPKSPCVECVRDEDCPIRGQKCCIDNDCKRRCIWPPGGQCPDPPRKPCLECENDRDCNKCQTCVMRLDGCKSECVTKTVESRPGFCPAERHPPWCRRCKTDSDCSFGREICCDVGCGFRRCVPRGNCRPTLQCCNSDCECNKDEKCCPIDCGFRCVKKVSKPPCGDCDRDADCPRWGQKCCYVNCKRTCVWPRDGLCANRPSKECFECENDNDCKNCEKCVKHPDGCGSNCVKSAAVSIAQLCPVIPPFVKCRKCKSNGDCPRSQRCCSNDCGFRECVDRDAIEAGSGECKLSCCKSDCDCDRGKKCCNSPCGKRCMKPPLCYNHCPCHRPGLLCCFDGCGNVCRKPTFSGTCPPEDRTMPCVTECRGRCRNNLMCCKTRCGTECLRSCSPMLDHFTRGE